MKKLTIVYGGPGTGKTLWAQSQVALEEKAITIHADNFKETRRKLTTYSYGNNPFSLQTANKGTKIIIVDECPQNFDWMSFANCATTPVTVHRKGEFPFTLEGVHFYFLTQEIPQLQGESLKRRFEVKSIDKLRLVID